MCISIIPTNFALILQTNTIGYTLLRGYFIFNSILSLKPFQVR